MAYALVTDVEAIPGASGGTTGAVDTTGASLLIIHVASFAAVDSVSDSKGNTWTPLTSHGGANSRHTRFWYAANPTVGSGHTFTVSGTLIFPHIAVAAFSGAATTSPFDQENGATSADATTLATGSVTPGEDNELLVSGCCGAMTSSPTINSGFTVTDDAPFGSGNNMQGGLAYLVQTSAAAVNPTWNFNNTGGVGASIATFKVAAVGGAVVGSGLTRSLKLSRLSLAG